MNASTTTETMPPETPALADADRADGATIDTTFDTTRDAIGVDVLQARASLLEIAVKKIPGITPEQLAAQQPGGIENRDASATGWLAYLCWLHGAYATHSATPAGARPARWDHTAMEDMRAALAAQPIPIILDHGRAVAVYPKGEHALNRLALTSLAAEWVTTQRLALMSAPQTAETLRAIDQAVEAERALLAEFVWVVTHAGPDVPWSDETTWAHTPPVWCGTEVTPFDLIAIRQAHVEVNLARISAIADRSRHLAEGGGEAMPLAVFLGVMASELAVQPEHLARRWSLGEIFAASLARWEATERAKRKADAQRPTT